VQPAVLVPVLVPVLTLSVSVSALATTLV